jgi:hypothetical protein
MARAAPASMVSVPRAGSAISHRLCERTARAEGSTMVPSSRQPSSSLLITAGRCAWMIAVVMPAAEASCAAEGEEGVALQSGSAGAQHAQKL